MKRKREREYGGRENGEKTVKKKERKNMKNPQKTVLFTMGFQRIIIDS